MSTVNRERDALHRCEAVDAGTCPDPKCTYAKPHVHGGLHESKVVQVQCPKNLDAWYSCVRVP